MVLAALATSHQGWQALQTMVRADMQRHGLDGDADRPFVPLGMFRDLTQFSGARSCLCTTTTARLWGGARR